ncbi:hypothetical protein VV01_21890 [Luteipulveratus halotolerans]|uniref:Major facilitator superfamily (MFS) profile domain-containing protein n=1 Tax=Luteipulveratus halotolerans TaxID=1631356 RepID=A0A0L6CE88_9MICO|nr:hypothetical protein VV01_21890 [Luteipulveratus halotolerans]
MFLAGHGADRGADQFFYVILAWAAAHSGSALSFGLIMTVGTLSRAVVTVFGGAVADRAGVVEAAIWSLAARVVLMLAFGWVLTASPLSSWALTGVALAFGFADGVHLPAMESAGTLVVDREHLRSFQGVLSWINKTATAAATPIAAVLIGWQGASAAAVTGAAVLGLALVSVVALHRRGLRSPARVDGQLLEMVRAGFSYALGRPQLATLLALFAIVNGLTLAPLVTGVALTGRDNNWSAGQYGLGYVGFFVGSLIGAGFIAVGRRYVAHGLRWSLMFVLGGCVGLAGMAVAGAPLIVCGFAALMGAFFGAGAALMMGDIKTETPPEYMGRVMSMVTMSIAGLQPVGYALYGWLAGVTSVATAGVTTAVTLAVAAAIVFVSPVARRRQVAPA